MNVSKSGASHEAIGDTLQSAGPHTSTTSTATSDHGGLSTRTSGDGAQRPRATLTDLPREVVLGVVPSLDPGDVMSLALASKAPRGHLGYHVFDARLLERASSVENGAQVLALLDPQTSATQTGQPNTIAALPPTLRAKALDRLANRLAEMSQADIDQARPSVQQAIEQLPTELQRDARIALQRPDPRTQAMMREMQRIQQTESLRGQVASVVGSAQNAISNLLRRLAE
jgi:hypothetical protein